MTQRCQYGRDDRCNNDARYITEDGSTFCGLCDMKTGATSIREMDIPPLLRLLGDIADRRRGRLPSDDVNELEGQDVAAMLALISKRGVTF